MKINQSYNDYIFDYKTMFSILYGGAGSGKSHAITQKLIIKGLQKSLTILVLRETGTSLNDSVIALFKTVLEEDNIPYTYRAFDRTLTFGRSSVLFKPAADPERIKSIAGVTDIWMEEASEMSPEMFTQLVLRLRSLNANLQFNLSFNPVSKVNWVYRFFFDPDDPEYFLHGRDFKIYKSTYKDNAFLPQEYIDNLLSLKRSNPNYYTIYGLGEFGTLGKLVFPHGSYTIGKVDVPLGTKQLWGCDPGVTDKFAIEGSYYIRSTNTLYTFKEFSYSEVLCKDVAKWIKQNINGGLSIYTDNAGKAQIQELRSLGCMNVIPNKKPPGSVLAGIDKLKSLNWVIDPSCEELILDLGVYSYEKDKKTGLYLNEPERETDGRHQNQIDAVRYSLEGISSHPTTFQPKTLRGLL